MKVAGYYCKNLTKVKRYLESLSPKSPSKCLLKCRELIEDDELVNELYVISDFVWLADTIGVLEFQNLRLDEVFSIMQAATERIMASDLDEAKNRLQKSVSKNPDLETLKNLKEIEEMILFKYAPLTSCDVERTFSKTKIFATDRTNFTENNLKKYYIVNCNANMIK